MSNMRSLRFLFVLLFAAFSSAALVLVDAGALGQNANSSMTTEDMAVVAPRAAQDDDSRGDLSGEKVDLSGTYTGNLATTGGREIGNGPATLTISGESFTLSTEGGATHTGRIYAVLTRGEVSAALYFPDMQDEMTKTPVVYNVRARKRGERLSLWPAPFTKAKLTFGAGRRR